ncbi:hypothetical protein [Methylocucumis oryzae]|uniref:hypothetical protein n=1 Tax=Methylocucumis oryzae TaxID=1632867 RepID=UPI0006982622|nr:hypothetical protein [Methylocucumis oryzae]
MMILRFLFFIAYTLILTGCAEWLTPHEPAPVYQRKAPVTKIEPELEPIPEVVKPVQIPDEIVAIKPLPEAAEPATVEIAPEPVTEAANPLLTPEQEQELAALEKAANAPSVEGQTPVPSAGEQATTPVTSSPSLPAPALESPTEQPVAKPEQAPFSPLTEFAPLSPAVTALVVAANQSTQSGNLQSASTTIERAIRIEPRNATLYYQLAVLRLKESKPRLAEDLAKKSALLAANDTQLKKHSWLLIAKARELQKNFDGAKEAKAKADAF